MWLQNWRQSNRTITVTTKKRVQVVGIFKQAVLNPSPDHFATSRSSARFFSAAVTERSSYNVAVNQEGVNARDDLEALPKTHKG
jgi:hypothetical protein